MRIFILLLPVFILAACADRRGFDRNDLRKQITYQNIAAADAGNKELASKPELPVPYKLAIYFVPPPIGFDYGGKREWLSKDKEKLVEICSEFKNRKILSDAFVISDLNLADGDYKAIFSAAAKGGADAVLIVNGTGSIDRYNNFLGISYFLLVTPLIVMGTEAEALFMVNASLWDVRNLHLYASVEAEGSARQTRPAFFVQENYLIDTAKSGAIAALKKELSKCLLPVGNK